MMTNYCPPSPKERINIRYMPATGRAQEHKELPLKLLVIGSFNPTPNLIPLGKRHPISIHKNNFDDILKAQNIHLKLNITCQYLSDSLTSLMPHTFTLNFTPQQLSDFKPNSLLKHPSLKKLFGVRTSLMHLKHHLLNHPEIIENLEKNAFSDPKS